MILDISQARVQLNDIANRSEVCLGPDRDIDFEIFRILFPTFAGPEWVKHGPGLRHVGDGSDMRSLPPVEHTPPYWTASYEVAESLIPDGMTLTLERWANAGVLVPYLFTATIQLGSIIAPKVKADFCRTAALAVTTAALRALASQEYDK